MQRLKKGTTKGDFLAQKKLKKRHQNACILWDKSLKNSIRNMQKYAIFH
jgi:hypothetical protein